MLKRIGKYYSHLYVVGSFTKTTFGAAISPEIGVGNAAYVEYTGLVNP